RPRPYRDRKRLRTGRLSSASRISRGQACASKSGGAVRLAVRFRVCALRFVCDRGGSTESCGQAQPKRISGTGYGDPDATAVLEKVSGFGFLVSSRLLSSIQKQ